MGSAEWLAPTDRLVKGHDGAGDADVGDEPEIMDVGVPPVSLLSVVARRLKRDGDQPNNTGGI